MGIANYKAYVKLNIDNSTSRVFSMNSIYTQDYQNKKIVPILKEYSAKKYGRRREFVDAETKARLGISIEEQELPENPQTPEGAEHTAPQQAAATSALYAEQQDVMNQEHAAQLANQQDSPPLPSDDESTNDDATNADEDSYEEENADETMDEDSNSYEEEENSEEEELDDEESYEEENADDSTEDEESLDDESGSDEEGYDAEESNDDLSEEEDTPADDSDPEGDSSEEAEPDKENSAPLSENEEDSDTEYYDEENSNEKPVTNQSPQTSNSE